MEVSWDAKKDILSIFQLGLGYTPISMACGQDTARSQGTPASRSSGHRHF